MPVIATLVRRLPALFAAVVAASAASAQPADQGYPTTEFADGASTASVTVGALTAAISMERRPRADPDFDSPVLTVSVDDAPVLEVVGVAAGFDFPATEASIAEIDPGNAGPEVFFTSYSGGAHCCTQAIVASEADGRWVAVPIGEFDGDGGYLRDADGDGVAEVVTYDNRFLYEFDCYACSTAPLMIVTVRGAKAYDASAEPRYLAAHRTWLEQLEEGIEPDEQWTSPGFLAGWVAAKIRAGEGDDAWKRLSDNWNFAADKGEEVCLVDREIDDCPKLSLATLTFPERLKRFLEHTHYMP